MSAESARTSPAGSAGAELDRVLTRLATLGPARLSRPVAPRSGPIGAPVPTMHPPGEDRPSPAELVRPLLQHLADVAADADGRRRRVVPVLADRAVPDQLAVLARDALDLVTGSEGRAGADEPSAGGADEPSAGGREPPAGVDVEELTARLVALRRALP